MANRSAVGVVLAVIVVALAAAGCNTTAANPVVADSATAHSSAAATTAQGPSAPTSSSAPAGAPTGPPAGAATMQVRGATSPVTIKYQINGGAEQTDGRDTAMGEAVPRVQRDRVLGDRRRR